MSRSRVDDRARAIYEFLSSNLNKPYALGDLLAAIGHRDSCTTRSAIRKARTLAEEDGVCFPIACPANGNTYCVTDNPAAVVDPSIHLGSIALGVGVRKDVHDEFIRSRMAQLDPVDRAMVHSLDRMGAAQRETRDAHREMMKAMVAMRRGRRDES